MRRSLLLVALLLLLAASAVPSDAANVSRATACPTTPASALSQAGAQGQPDPLFATALPCGCALFGMCSDNSPAVDTCPGRFVGSSCTYCGEAGQCFAVYTGGSPTRCPDGPGYMCTCLTFV